MVDGVLNHRVIGRHDGAAWVPEHRVDPEVDECVPDDLRARNDARGGTRGFGWGFLGRFHRDSVRLGGSRVVGISRRQAVWRGGEKKKPRDPWGRGVWSFDSSRTQPTAAPQEG